MLKNYLLHLCGCTGKKCFGKNLALLIYFNHAKNPIFSWKFILHSILAQHLGHSNIVQLENGKKPTNVTNNGSTLFAFECNIDYFYFYFFNSSLGGETFTS